MTDDRMALFELVEKADSSDFLKTLLEHTLNRLMQFQVDNVCNAAPHERSDERQNQRNGYRERHLETRVGKLDLRIPKLRSGTYFPPFLEPRRLTEKALAAVVQEAYIGGMSTRRVDELVQAMGMTGISKSQVSELVKEVDGRVNAFLERPLTGEWPYVWLDATYVKVREGGRVVSRAAIIATGVNRLGQREILGLGLGVSEAREFWIEFLRGLVRRGLAGVRLVISDSHEGLKAAAAQVLAAPWQRCRVHFMRNMLAYAHKTQHSVVAAAIRQVFVQPDPASAHATWRQVTDTLAPRYPKIAALMDDAEADVLAYYAFPVAHRTKIYSTNPLERLNKEVKRRTNVVGIFPNELATRRLVGAVLMEQNDDWVLQNRYLSLETMAEIDAVTPEAVAPTLLAAAA